jgi:hypothetical protein
VTKRLKTVTRRRRGGRGGEAYEKEIKKKTNKQKLECAWKSKTEHL